MKKDLFPVVILAGGLATRLHPLTTTIPKSLVEIRGEPFIAHQLRLLSKNNIKKVMMCIGFLGEQIIEQIGNGQQFGLEVSYSFDGPELRGTAGAIKQALAELDDEFFVLYGDSYLTCDYSAAQTTFQREKKSALMTVFRNQGRWDTSNVEFKENTILVYDKKNRNERMQHIDYGLGLFHKSAFDWVLPNDTYDLADLYQTLLSENQLAAHEVGERFYEIGSFSGIKEFESYISSQ